MAIGKKLRFEVLKRDGFCCRYCGKRGSEKGMHVDHVVPKSRGGKDIASNLVAACIDCNIGKSNTPLSAPVVASPEYDRVIDEALIRAETVAWMIDRSRNNRDFTESDMLEAYFPFPQRIPDDFAW